MKILSRFGELIKLPAVIKPAFLEEIPLPESTMESELIRPVNI